LGDSFDIFVVLPQLPAEMLFGASCAALMIGAYLFIYLIPLTVPQP
jgi:hypothetical protein